MSVSNLEELEEALSEILPRGFTIETDDNGQLVIYTGLSSDEDGELMEFEGDEDDDDLDTDDDDLSLEDEPDNE